MRVEVVGPRTVRQGYALLEAQVREWHVIPGNIGVSVRHEEDREMRWFIP